MKSGAVMSHTGTILKHIAALVGATALAACIAGCNQQPQSTAANNAPAPTMASVATNDIGKTPELQQAALTMGKDIYDKNCSSCHGADLKGSADHHTPDLTDDYWMFAGDDVN